MENLDKDPLSVTFSMLTERLSAVEASGEATRAQVQGTHAMVTALTRQGLRSRAQEVVDPKLMFVDEATLGGARVARLLSAMEGSSKTVLICVRREDGEELRSACTTGGLTVQEEWDWFRHKAVPLMPEGQAADWLAAATPPPYFVTEDGGMCYIFLDRVINGTPLKRMQPDIVGPVLPADIRVHPEYTLLYQLIEPGMVSSSFRHGVRLAFSSDEWLFVDQWLQRVLPAFRIGAGQQLSVAIHDLAKGRRCRASLAPSIAYRIFEDEQLPGPMSDDEEEEDGMEEEEAEEGN